MRFEPSSSADGPLAQGAAASQARRRSPTRGQLTLQEFRVENFRNIDDSGWIPVDRITTLLGRNESGKTALLQGPRDVPAGILERACGLFQELIARFEEDASQQRAESGEVTAGAKHAKAS
jgi:hypothetical protein